DSNLMQLLPVHFAKSMVDMLIGGAQESTASAPVASTPEPAPAAVPATPAPVAEQPPVQHQQAPQAPQQPAQDYNG
ncbi:flagellar motor switch phosphatase FliY, partial [Clostridioides difficile]